MSSARLRAAPVVVTAAAVRTALGDSRGEILRRAALRSCALTSSAAIEQNGTPEPSDDRTFACAGGPIGPDRAEALLAATIADALREAGLDDPARRAGLRVRVVIGTTLNGMRHVGAYLRGGPARDAASLNASSVGATACAQCGLPAAAITISTACASGITTIGVGCDLLRSDEADVVIAGGYDPISEFSHAGFGGLRLLAENAPRPFARDRDGMRTAEGYALLVLERRDDAVRRGVRVLAQISAVAESSDAFHLTQPQPEGSMAARAVMEACALGGMPDLLVAHATGTEANDAAEFNAYALAFASRLAGLPVTAPKGTLGHTLGAAGAVDAALCIGMAEAGSIMPTSTDPQSIDRDTFGSLRLITEPCSMPLRRTMNVALGFGGSNAALAMTHGDTRDAVPLRVEADQLVADERRELAPAFDNDAPLVITGWSAIVPGSVLSGDALATLDRVPPGIIDDALLAPMLDPRSSRRIAPVSRLVRAAVRLAVDDARLDSSMLETATAFCASEHGAIGYSIDAYRAVVSGGLGAGNPLLFAESVPNVPGAQCSLAFGVRGAAITVIGSRVGFVEALLLARARLRAGRAERVILVVAEERHADLDAVLVAWKQSCGGDARCTTGAAAVIIERAADAEARGATVRAEIGSIHWAPPALRSSREMMRAGACVAATLSSPIDVPGRPGLLGRMERRIVGTRLGVTLDSEAHALGLALLALRRAARGEHASVLALDPFGATGALELHPATVAQRDGVRRVHGGGA